MFGFSPFADTPFASLANKSVSGTLAVTLDDVSVVMAGKDIHSGTLSVQLDDVSVSAQGKTVHNGNLSLQLDDIDFIAAGTDSHNGSLSLTLDDVVINFLGGKVDTGTLSVQLDNIVFSANGTVTPPSVQLVTKGGLPKKKIKKEREEVEKAVTKAVNKSLGIVEPEDIVEQVEETKQPEIDYTAQINDMVLRMQAEALGLSIEQYLIESELDDEEAILLFL